jgi:sulfide:quinone oxidoreductase
MRGFHILRLGRRWLCGDAAAESVVYTDGARSGAAYARNMGVDPIRVLVAGGGVAGLEAVLALQALAGDRTAIELLAPERHFTYRPLSVAEPFTPGMVQRFPLAAIGDERGVRVHRDALARVLSDERVVETQGGAALAYDTLVLALGAKAVEAVRGALTFRGPQDAGRVRTVVDALREGTIRRVAFVVPRGTTWALPLYELALQTTYAARKVAPGAELTVVTPEPSPLAAFGEAASAEVAALLESQGVTLLTGAAVDEVAEGRLWMGLEGSFRVDHVIALPALVGPHPRGVPSDPLGFVPVDEYTRVLRAEGMFAVGDVAAHGVKQGGLAAQQADVAAAVIAADAGVAITPEPYRPVLRGLLLTGSDAHFLRHDREGSSELSDEPLWWPAAKIAGRHLAPYLAAHLDLGLAAR